MKVAELPRKYHQSVWLDYIRRHLLESGEFARMVKEGGISGVTSNPSIFEKAIAGSTDYDSELKRFEGVKDQTAAALYEHLAVADIREAADILRPVYDKTEGHDGFVSMEVSPYLAHETQATVDEARRLWKTVDRKNLMVKVPATPEGIPAIRQLIGEGINVNVTLLFSRTVCRQVFEAYMGGLEVFFQREGDLSKIASVASMFVSRIDVMVDSMLESRMVAFDAPVKAAMTALIGKVAIANAKLTYQDWKETCGGPRWQALEKRGARAQRLLWASTSAKDPNFRDVVYVEELIGPETVDTIPPETLDAFRDHGKAGNRLEKGIEDARQVMSSLAYLGISIDEVTERLVAEGVKAFSSAFDALMASIEKKRDGALQSALDRMSYHLPGPIDAKVTEELVTWRVAGKVRRLWARDASLWTGRDEGRWLDWLTIPGKESAASANLRAFAADIKSRGFTHAVVLGMGGSSLCPDVLSRVFEPAKGYPELLVLDSTDPAQILALEARIDFKKTLFIVSSKSGTTLEPNILKDYFYERVSQAIGGINVGGHFAAITDTGTPLQRIAETEHYLRVLPGELGIGGRYSALSNFGMVPAAIMGLDVARFLDRTALMVNACASCVPPKENPGVLLGVILGVAGKSGRDKVTIIASPGIAPLGAWLGQLLAESTGKEGKGLIPVDGEPLGAPESYGDDRIFAYLRLDDAPNEAQDASVDALMKAGHAVVRISIADVHDIGQEFFRWEIAVAVACSILEVNAFNQPDVEASKAGAKELTEAYEKSGVMPKESSFCRYGTLELFADDRNRSDLDRATGSDKTLQGYLNAHLGLLRPGDYFALLAYIERSQSHDDQLQSIRRAVRGKRRVATCLGFGPRFLHSTGQVYKGGPNSGVFLQLTCDDAHDVKIPGRQLSFGIVKASQARGDLKILTGRGRRVLRVHLGIDVDRGLSELVQTIDQALA
jgi:transaldolase/glucose-6-phosphate isomerase